jgi:hypothetical protein
MPRARPKRNVITIGRTLRFLDRVGEDCGGTRLGRPRVWGKIQTTANPIRCQLDNMVTQQDKVRTTDQSHGAPAIVPAMLHFARGRSRTQGDRQSGGKQHETVARSAGEGPWS